MSGSDLNLFDDLSISDHLSPGNLQHDRSMTSSPDIVENQFVKSFLAQKKLDENQENQLIELPSGVILLSNDYQVNSLSSMPSGSKKSGLELVSDDLSNAKGKGKMEQSPCRRTIVNSESYILTVMAVLDELYRIFKNMPLTARAKKLERVVKAMISEFEGCRLYIMKISKNNNGSLAEVAKGSLVNAHNWLDGFLQRLENSREEVKQISKGLENTRNLDEIFIKNMDYSLEDLREKYQHGVNQQLLPYDNQVNSLGSMPSGSKKRGREVSDDSSKAEGKGKMKRRRGNTIVNGESAPSTKAVPVNYEEYIKGISVETIAKNLTDRVSKRNESVLAVLGVLHFNKNKPSTARAEELVRVMKAMTAECEGIRLYTRKKADDYNNHSLTGEAAKESLVDAHYWLEGFLQRLQNAREEVKRICRDLEKVENLVPIFIDNMDHTTPEELRKKLASVLPFDIKELDQN